MERYGTLGLRELKLLGVTIENVDGVKMVSCVINSFNAYAIEAAFASMYRCNVDMIMEGDVKEEDMYQHLKDTVKMKEFWMDCQEGRVSTIVGEFDKGIAAGAITIMLDEAILELDRD